MFERPSSGENTLLVFIDFHDGDFVEESQEFESLARSAGCEIVSFISGTRVSPDARFFVGTGKTEEIREAIHLHNTELVIFNHALSPAQERNLEAFFECRVLDRSGLILDIFAQRARTFEGKLQVELAQLKHLSTRLVRGWTHLERQKGGIGLRGPGETQLETDRRLLGERVKHIQGRLQRVGKQREQNRSSRRRTDTPTVALIGYTNAGKSTLFNQLTQSKVYAADQLFATLDPTLRRLSLGNGTEVVLADTVGFINHLPHELIAAFRSTLQETVEATLLLHVVDAHDPMRQIRIAQVNEVLKDIGAADVPVLMIYNKIDLLADHTPKMDTHDGVPQAVWLSAIAGSGRAELLEAIALRTSDCILSGALLLGPELGAVRAELFRLNAILQDQIDEENGGWQIQFRLPIRHLRSLITRFPQLTPQIQPLLPVEED